MKLAVFTALVFSLAMSPLVAEPPEGGHERDGQRHHGARGSRDPSGHLTEALGLSEDQAAEMQAIFEAQRADHEAMREAQEEQREAFMAERCARKAEVEGQIAGILTDEQLVQFEEMKAKRADRAGRHEEGAERMAAHEAKIREAVEAGELTEEEAQERMQKGKQRMRGMKERHSRAMDTC